MDGQGGRQTRQSGWKRLVALGMVAVLASCGGGGGDEAPVPMAVVYEVGGTLSGLGAGKSVVVGQAGGASASLNANGAYSLKLPAGTGYDLRVQSQPEGQNCTVSNGTGVANADVNNIAVTCVDGAKAFKVGGTVAGLGTGRSLTLVLDASGAMQEASASSDGRFAFSQPVSGAYKVTVKTQLPGLGCGVSRGEGTVTADIADVEVICTPDIYHVSGTANGLSAPVRLSNNGETLVVPGNGAFQFGRVLTYNESYNVVVVDAGMGQTCSVANSAGLAKADVTNIQLSCTAVVAPPPPPVAVPGTPANLTMTYGLKSFNLSWGTVTAPAGGGSVTYQLLEDPDGAGPLVATPVGGNLAGNTATYSVAGLLHAKINARYSVRACNAGGCGTPGTAVAANLNQAVGYFKASNTDANDKFGMALAISGDGNTLAVGATDEDSNATGVNGNQADNSTAAAGAVYVFVRSASGAWLQQAYVKSSHPRDSDYFGQAVALSNDGSTLAVGAPGDDSNATGINGAHNLLALNSGAAYVFSRAAGVWAQQAYVKASNTGAADRFGIALALSGDGNTLAVSAMNEGSNATGVNGNQADNSAANSGAAYVFARTGNAWTQQAYVKASNTETNDIFGHSIALSADGATLAVGTYNEDSSATGVNGDQASNGANNSGAVYVFARLAGAWTQQAYVKASNTQAADSFGWSIALSADGGTMAVSAITEASGSTTGNQADNSLPGAGAVYLFARTAGTWTQQAYVKAPNPGQEDYFGVSVALSADGNKLAVGAYSEDGGNTFSGANADNGRPNSGAVYMYTRTGGAWVLQHFVKASNTELNDNFGGAVGLSADGGTLAVGAHNEASAATGIGGDASSNALPSAGAVYLY